MRQAWFHLYLQAQREALHPRGGVTPVVQVSMSRPQRLKLSPSLNSTFDEEGACPAHLLDQLHRHTYLQERRSAGRGASLRGRGCLSAEWVGWWRSSIARSAYLSTTAPWLSSISHTSAYQHSATTWRLLLEVVGLVAFTQSLRTRWSSHPEPLARAAGSPRNRCGFWPAHIVELDGGLSSSASSASHITWEVDSWPLGSSELLELRRVYYSSHLLRSCW